MSIKNIMYDDPFLRLLKLNALNFQFKVQITLSNIKIEVEKCNLDYKLKITRIQY